MSATHGIPPLPEAQAYLQGKDGVKALQHDAAALRSFVDGFEQIPLKPQAAERMVEFGELMRHPEWLQAHDAAHRALLAARKAVTENPAAGLAAESHNVQSIFNAQAVNPGTLKMVKHPELQTLFEPLKIYLEKFGGFVTGWASMAPARMRPGAASLTPAAHRATLGAAPHCGDPECTIIHAPRSPDAAVSSKAAPHAHGPGCGHSYEPRPSKSIKHGGLWAMGAVGTVCVGA